jgi:5-methylthioadenosine/S-adenosylhomocysteine deaminase
VRSLTAKYVLPITGDPIENGAVVVDGDEILYVGPRPEAASRFPQAEIDDLGFAAILPGLVNCHSHLEITAMRGMLDSVEHDFAAWLLKLNLIRAGLSADDLFRSAEAGALEGARSGVTCFGDVGRFGEAGREALKATGLRGVVFQETEFGPDNATAAADFETLRGRFEGLRKNSTPLVAVGLSPHSPYTVSRRLFELIAEFAKSEAFPVSIHAAESQDEEHLLLNGQGFFSEIYRKFDVTWQHPGCSSINYLESTGILASRPLLVHCVTVSDEDITVIANGGARVAHCPKSNAKFGHGSAPFEKFLNAGIALGLGSDSVASNNVCDLIEESRYAVLTARSRPGRSEFLSAADALRAATMGGAAALGLESRIGSLEPGKQADLAVFSLTDRSQLPLSDVNAAIVFSSNARDVVSTIVAGKTVFRDDTAIDNCRKFAASEAGSAGGA